MGTQDIYVVLGVREPRSFRSGMLRPGHLQWRFRYVLALQSHSHWLQWKLRHLVAHLETWCRCLNLRLHLSFSMQGPPQQYIWSVLAVPSLCILQRSWEPLVFLGNLWKRSRKKYPIETWEETFDIFNFSLLLKLISKYKFRSFLIGYF